VNEQDKAVVRSFLSNSSGKEWLENARLNVPKLKLSESTKDLYVIGLAEKEGWMKCLEFLSASVLESSLPEYGVTPIDTVSD
jgi:hypothetical protein